MSETFRLFERGMPIAFEIGGVLTLAYVGFIASDDGRTPEKLVFLDRAGKNVLVIDESGLEITTLDDTRLELWFADNPQEVGLVEVDATGQESGKRTVVRDISLVGTSAKDRPGTVMFQPMNVYDVNADVTSFLDGITTDLLFEIQGEATQISPFTEKDIQWLDVLREGDRFAQAVDLTNSGQAVGESVPLVESDITIGSEGNYLIIVSNDEEGLSTDAPYSILRVFNQGQLVNQVELPEPYPPSESTAENQVFINQQGGVVILSQVGEATTAQTKVIVVAPDGKVTQESLSGVVEHLRLLDEAEPIFRLDQSRDILWIVSPQSKDQLIEVELPVTMQPNEAFDAIATGIEQYHSPDLLLLFFIAFITISSGIGMQIFSNRRRTV